MNAALFATLSHPQSPTTLLQLYTGVHKKMKIKRTVCTFSLSLDCPIIIVTTTTTSAVMYPSNTPALVPSLGL